MNDFDSYDSIIVGIKAYAMNSKYYRRPDGGKRSPYAFSPFLGGARVCLGKTFAEVTLKFMIPLWYHFFEFATLVLLVHLQISSPVYRNAFA